MGWIHTDYGLSEMDAYELLSKVAEIHLNEMVDPNYVVVAKIKKSFLPRPVARLDRPIRPLTAWFRIFTVFLLSSERSGGNPYKPEDLKKSFADHDWIARCSPHKCLVQKLSVDAFKDELPNSRDPIALLG